MLLINNIKIAVRNAMRNKLFSLINISGLALGLACCLVIVLYVTQELSYDKYHDNSENIYRVGLDAKINDTQLRIPSSHAPLGDILVNNYPEVLNYVRIDRQGEIIVKINDRKHSIDKIFATDSTFFDIFTVKFIAGNKGALRKANTIVITEDLAKRYFKSAANAMGQIMSFGRKDYTITAVVENCPYNTHLKYSALFSQINNRDIVNANWGSDRYATYILTKDNTDYKKLEINIQEVVKEHILPMLKKWLKIDMTLPNYYNFYLMPLENIHLHSHSIIEFEENGNSTYVNMFIIIAIFILLIACINFSNLSTAKASTRAKEIGIKKALGSGKKRLMAQFFSESIFISIIAFIFAIVIVETCLPIINNIIGVKLQPTLYSDFYVLFRFIGIAILTGLIAGAYSALYLSSFNPVKILKGEFTIGKKSNRFRGTLVIFQFAISIILIISTLIVNQQLNFMNDRDLGYKKNNLIKIDNARRIKNKDLFRQKIKEIPAVKDLTFATDLPGKFCNGGMIRKCDSEDKNTYNIRVLGCDVNYINTMGSKIIKGRFFNKGLTSDSLTMIINEACVKELNLTNPIGTKLKFPLNEKKFTIIGIIKDVHTMSLKTKVFPTIVMINSPRNTYGRLAIRISDKNQAASLKQIQTVWNEFTDNTPMKYEYLDDVVNQMNVSENNNLKIFTSFSFIAIFIALIGLLGLVSFTIEQKVKEIGVRKVLGAPVSSIIIRLNMDIIKWIGISFIIACPCAYLLMDNWLQDFVYKINIGVGVFIISGLCTMIITLSAVSWQALRAARMNPVDCLRSE